MKLHKHANGYYYARLLTPEGSREISTRAKSREEAERIVRETNLKDIEIAGRCGRLTAQAIGLITAGRKITVDKAVTDFERWLATTGRSPSTILNTAQYVRAWAAFANTLHLAPAMITEDQINAWVNAPSDSCAGTRNVMLCALRSFFGFCSAKGWSLGDPSRLVVVNLGLLSHAQKEPRQRECFTEGEVQALLNATALGTFWHSAVAIGRYTGLRLADIAALEWASFAKRGSIIVWTAKRDKRVELPLEPIALAGAVSAIPCINEFCFPAQREIAQDAKRRSLLSVQFSRLCKSEGIEGKSFHSLRHHYVTDAYERGLSLDHIRQRVGHSSTETTRGYVHER